MDRAGYCFGSTLGIAAFDNADCTGKSVSVSAAGQKTVVAVRERENAMQCKVDTAAPLLDLPDVDIRRRLRDLPIRNEFESGCIDWLREEMPLRIGRDSASTVIGVIRPGDTVSFAHDTADGWEYVTVRTSDWQYKSAGWTQISFGEGDCRQYAG